MQNNWLVSLLAVALLTGTAVGYNAYKHLVEELSEVRLFANDGIDKNSAMLQNAETKLQQLDQKFLSRQNLVEDYLAGLRLNQDVLQGDIAGLKEAAESSLQIVQADVANIKEKTDKFKVQQNGNSLLFEPTQRKRIFYTKENQPIKAKQPSNTELSTVLQKKITSYESQIAVLRNELEDLKSQFAIISSKVNDDGRSFSSAIAVTEKAASERSFTGKYSSSIKMSTQVDKCRKKAPKNLACIKTIKVAVTNIDKNHDEVKLTIQSDSGERLVNSSTSNENGKAIFEIVIESSFIRKGQYTAYLSSEWNDRLISETFKL